MNRLAAVDAQTMWMSAKIPNDQFLLYAFAGDPGNLPDVLAGVRARAQSTPELTVRVAQRAAWRYPVWVQQDVTDDQIVVHGERHWGTTLEAIARLFGRQLDAQVMPWRLHVFAPVADVPGARHAVVAVLQVAHVLGDGVRSSALAAHLFGRSTVIPSANSTVSAVSLPWRMFRAAHMHRRLVADTAAGIVVPPAPTRPALRSNAIPGSELQLRTVLIGRDRLAGPTVTVAVLAAVSDALAAHLRALGEEPSQLGAEVPMAKSGNRLANNQFGNVGIALHPELARAERMTRIAHELADRRQRGNHPAMHAAALASAAVPAPLLRWGVMQFDPQTRSETVIGNTVVSSVDRGAADLRFGAAPVVFTAGYPALSPMMGLTHGVHGIGGTVAVSVAATAAIGDVDAYVERLQVELHRA